MAHKIDFSKGKAAFISFQEKAWHGLGEIMKDAISARDALQRAGLDFEVMRLPNIHTIPDVSRPGEFIQIVSKESFFTLRTDVNKILGTRLGKDYHVLQNIDALDVVDEILQQGTATIETAGALDEGRRVFICLKLNKGLTVNGNDTIMQYLLVCTSHDGSLSTTVLLTNVRVVCANTLGAALSSAKGALKIRHTKNAKSKLGEAVRILKVVEESSELNLANYSKMAETKISPETMTAFFYNVFCTPEQIAGLQANNPDMIKTVSKNPALKDVADFAVRGIGQQKTLIGGLNMWTAYNAVTGYLTKKGYANTNDRAKSLLFGTSADYIKDAGTLALAPAKIQPIKKQIISAVSLN